MLWPLIAAVVMLAAFYVLVAILGRRPGLAQWYYRGVLRINAAPAVAAPIRPPAPMAGSQRPAIVAPRVIRGAIEK
jgi:hypothetical protein